MSRRELSHSRERYKRGRIRTWVIEEKLDGKWRTVKNYTGENGPKAQKGQRIRLLKKGEIQGGLTYSKEHMSDKEIKDTLGW